jgi:hypothetical protein
MARPRSGQEKGKILFNINFNIYENDLFKVGKAEFSGKELVKKLVELKRVDPFKSFSDIVKDLLAEAAHHHHPGNPGLPLEHWTEGRPLSAAAHEKMWGNACPDCNGSGLDKLGATCSRCAGLGRVGEGEHY